MDWIKLSIGLNVADLEHDLSSSVKAKIVSGIYKDSEVKYLAEHSLNILSGRLDVERKVLESLRAMASSWEVRVFPPNITSHRPILGPIIVRLKKLLLPLLSKILDKTLEQQRQFNAKTLETIIFSLKAKEQEVKNA